MKPNLLSSASSAVSASVWNYKTYQHEHNIRTLFSIWIFVKDHVINLFFIFFKKNRIKLIWQRYFALIFSSIMSLGFLI
jgi:hypothetical protein